MESLIYYSLITLISLAQGTPVERKFKDYSDCPTGEKDKLNVHLICHTHDDVGWLKTVDQYYYGGNNDIQLAGVQYIIESVIQNLEHDRRRKFIYVESAFFSRWWSEQPDSIRKVVTNLVCSGQLEFAGGGWSMHDEAAVHYNSVIDQMTHGLKFLNDTFGYCGRPKVAWQIDPFGHTKEQASMFAQMYFDGLFFGRLDYEDKMNRRVNKEMEFVWEPSINLGTKSQLFTGVLPNAYQPPEGFCFDILCNDDPINDDPFSRENNVDQKIRDFIQAAEKQAHYYVTNQLIMTMGSDFHYQSAEMWFQNLDKLIKYVNKQQNNGSRVNIFYSTPSCYLYALNKAGQTWTVKTDDFIPYASDPSSYWTGFYTSRPALKRLERIGNNKLQVAKQLAAVNNIGGTNLNVLRDAMGVLQHHDAVTGTAKQHVADDYEQMLKTAMTQMHDIIGEAYEKIIPKDKSVHLLKQNFCKYLSPRHCYIIETPTPSFAVTIYNPLAWATSEYIHISVPGSTYTVTDYNGKNIDIQIIPIFHDFSGRSSPMPPELVFETQLPPLGYATYLVTPVPRKETKEKGSLFEHRNEAEEDWIIKNEFLTVYVDGKSGLLKKLQLNDSYVLNVKQSFYCYHGMGPGKRASGAYIFRPDGTSPINLGDDVQVFILKGSIVQEIRQTFKPWLSQIIRLYKNKEYVEFDWKVGPIPVDDGIGKEIITRFDTDIRNKDIFYTDSNGREMVKRKKDYRPTWDYVVTEPVAGNYYPVNSRIYIKEKVNTFLTDKKPSKQFTVLNDRSQGGSSLNSGSIEIMIHRRLLYDDGFGMDEALNEPGVDGQGLVVRGSHYLLFGDASSSAIKHRPLAHSLFMQPQISIASHDLTAESYMEKYNMIRSELKEALPPNVHLLTLEPWEADSVLIRLEHIYEYQEDPQLGKSVTVSLKGLFKNFKITSIVETTLDANQYLSEAKRLCWNSDISPNACNDSQFKDPGDTHILLDISKVKLTPMQIRTFIAKVSYEAESQI